MCDTRLRFTLSAVVIPGFVLFLLPGDLLGADFEFPSMIFTMSRPCSPVFFQKSHIHRLDSFLAQSCRQI